MAQVVQVNGVLDRAVKRRLFAELARREVKFVTWLQEQANMWLDEHEGAVCPTSERGEQANGHR